jgi:hypothetical protein
VYRGRSTWSLEGMRHILIGLLVVLAVSACGISPGRKTAMIECVSPRGTPERYIISLTSPNGQWKISGHGIGLYQELQIFSIELPERPPLEVRYMADQIHLFKETGNESVAVPMSGGYVEISSHAKRIVVALDASGIPFWANGPYRTDAF